MTSRVKWQKKVELRIRKEKGEEDEEEEREIDGREVETL